MKRTIFAASCAVLVSLTFSSCQKESKSVVELAHDLTTELRAVTDTATADAHAPRVAVLNKRFENAKVRVLALNDTALYRAAESDSESVGTDYAAAMKALAREIGRVRASFPVTSSDGEVDSDRLLITIAQTHGATGTPDELKEEGVRYMQDTNNQHETPGDFAEYYGSEKLRDALAYRASVTSVSNMKFDSAADVPAVPALKDEPQEVPTATSGQESDGGATSSGDESESSESEDSGDEEL